MRYKMVRAVVNHPVLFIAATITIIVLTNVAINITKTILEARP